MMSSSPAKKWIEDFSRVRPFRNPTSFSARYIKALGGSAQRSNDEPLGLIDGLFPAAHHAASPPNFAFRYAIKAAAAARSASTSSSFSLKVPLNSSCRVMQCRTACSSSLFVM